LGNDGRNPNPRLTNSEEAPSQSAHAAWPPTIFASQRERRTMDLTTALREDQSGELAEWLWFVDRRCVPASEYMAEGERER